MNEYALYVNLSVMMNIIFYLNDFECRNLALVK